jgi:hypothetical protein
VQCVSGSLLSEMLVYVFGRLSSTKAICKTVRRLGRDSMIEANESNSINEQLLFDKRYGYF